MKLHFNANDIKELLEHSRGSKTRTPTVEQRFDGYFRFDGEDLPQNAIGSVKNWPPSSEIDGRKVPCGLWLVADHGAYLMSNGDPNAPSRATDSRYRVAQAFETDPSFYPNSWCDNQRNAFGDKDSVTFVDEAFIRAVLRLACGAVACISISDIGFSPAAPIPAQARRFALNIRRPADFKSGRPRRPTNNQP